MVQLKRWADSVCMQHSKKLRSELEASNLSELSSILDSFFLRADHVPDLRVWTVSRLLRAREELGTFSSSNPLAFRRGPCIVQSSRLPCSSRRISCLLFQSNN